MLEVRGSIPLGSTNLRGSQTRRHRGGRVPGHRDACDPEPWIVSWRGGVPRPCVPNGCLADVASLTLWRRWRARLEPGAKSAELAGCELRGRPEGHVRKRSWFDDLRHSLPSTLAWGYAKRLLSILVGQESEMRVVLRRLLVARLALVPNHLPDVARIVADGGPPRVGTRDGRGGSVSGNVGDRGSA
jgi:hypothetical protein